MSSANPIQIFVVVKNSCVLDTNSIFSAMLVKKTCVPSTNPIQIFVLVKNLCVLSTNLIPSAVLVKNRVCPVQIQYIQIFVVIKNSCVLNTNPIFTSELVKKSCVSSTNPIQVVEVAQISCMEKRLHSGKIKCCVSKEFVCVQYKSNTDLSVSTESLCGTKSKYLKF